MVEVKDTFEIVVEVKDTQKTFVSKKMNPLRRAVVMEKLMSPMAMANKKGEEDNTAKEISSTVALFKILPEVMWDFVKDEDKKEIGTLGSFAEGVDDENSIQFMKWCIMKLQKMQSFLGQNVETAKL